MNPFVDTSVLMAAACRANAGCQDIWNIDGVEVATSLHAFYSAQLNLQQPWQKEREVRLNRLQRIIDRTRIVPDAEDEAFPSDVDLPEHCRRILLTAIEVGASHFITSDVRHYGDTIGARIGGLLIQLPGRFLQSVELPINRNSG